MLATLIFRVTLISRFFLNCEIKVWRKFHIIRYHEFLTTLKYSRSYVYVYSNLNRTATSVAKTTWSVAKPEVVSSVTTNANNLRGLGTTSKYS